MFIELCQKGEFECIKYLEEEDFRQDNDQGLKQACKYGHINIVRFLVEEKGADINSGEDWAIHLATKNGHMEVILYLLEKGASVERCRDTAFRFRKTDILKILNHMGYDLKMSVKFNSIENAIKEGNLEFIKVFIDFIYNGIKGILYLYRIFYISLLENQTEIIHYLIQNINMNVVLDKAIDEGNLTVVSFLLEKGFNVNKKHLMKRVIKSDHQHIIKYIENFIKII